MPLVGGLARPSSLVNDPLSCGLLAVLSAAARRWIVDVRGIEYIRAAHDPFIVAINHSTRIEVLLASAMMIEHRAGRLIHFLADWNYRLIPGIGMIYRCAQTISVMRKPARPAILNLLKPLYTPAYGPLHRATDTLRAGSSVGIFPEGKINTDRRRLMPGFRGAAYLSIKTGVPIVPVGIRFPDAPPDFPVSDFAAMEIFIGAPMTPPRAEVARPTRGGVHNWHAAMMGEIGRLSGKTWTNSSVERASATAGDRQ